MEKVEVLWGIPRNWTQFLATQVMRGRSRGTEKGGCPRKEQMLLQFGLPRLPVEFVADFVIGVFPPFPVVGSLFGLTT